MTVGRVCSREVDTADVSESAQVAAQRMHARNVGSLVVVNDSGYPIGIVTDRDLTTRVLANGRDSTTTKIGDVMTAKVATVTETTSIENALGLMRQAACRRIPVVDDAGALVGLLSLDDILDLLSEEFNQIGALIRREGPQSLSAG